MSAGKGKARSDGGQALLSSFFSQSPAKSSARPLRRARSPVDLTVESDSDEFREVESSRPAKKRKVTAPSTPSTPKKAAPVPSLDVADEHDIIQQYRFDPHATTSTASNPAKDAERVNRREQAKRILLASGNIIEQQLQLQASELSGSDAEGDISEDDEEEEVVEPQGTPEAFNELMSMVGGKPPKAKKRKPPPKTTLRQQAKNVREIGPSGKPYTPLELQVRELKRKYPGVVLMFEVGYKVIFYGEDAQIAAKHLNIACYPKRNFLNATFPVHRREVHLKKLLSQGLKVGIIEQTETAALKKAGDNRNDVFGRKLTHLYTSATFVDQLDSVDLLDPTNVPPLMCIIEEPQGGLGPDERVLVSIISVCASTGDITWDQFEDNHMRTELETRLVHVSPSELLLPESGLSKPTEKLLNHCMTHSHAEYKTRIERFKKLKSYTDAFSYVTKFYTDKNKAAIASESFKSGELMAAVANFPKQVVVALSHLMEYLATLNVEDVLLETKFFVKFTERTHMLLNGNTLTNLEIYRNETDYSKKGSLLWILDHTTTKFGARLLKAWIGRPLTDKAALNARIDAVEEILSTTSPRLPVLRQLLRGLPDLARGLCRIQYGRCTPQELAVLLPAFEKVATVFDRVPDNTQFDSPVLTDIMASLPRLRDPIRELLGEISLKMAKEGRKEAMWTNMEKLPDVDGLTVSIQIAESELMDELRKVRKELRRPALQYSTVNGEEYVIELKKSELRDVPPRWKLISSTRAARRLRTPEMTTKLQERAQLKEALEAEASRVLRSFLEEISHKYYALLRDAVNKLAIADCLLSLALVAVQEGYVRPRFSDSDVLEIEEGRHPMVEKLRDDPFVPNTVQMSPRHKIITGPNMGGKSSAVGMIALCAIMAQIGSYVPAASMQLGMLDGVFTRMGASDELARGRSTFMVELQETSDILQLATPRSLVILDELGRGTSTFDGMAIAGAVLRQLIEKTKCKTLFITHYPDVARDLEHMFPDDVENLHMGYTEDTRIDGRREVTFLYRLTAGLTTSSFGVECARLAGVPEMILRAAMTQAANMQTTMETRTRRNRMQKILQAIQRTIHATDKAEQHTTLTELIDMTSTIPA